MSELKISKDSIQNGILKDGQFVFGTANDSASLHSIDGGSFAHGYCNGEGQIRAKGRGAHAEGFSAYKTEYVYAYGDGAHAEGIGTTARGDGAHAEGKGFYGTEDYYDGTGTYAQLDYIEIEQYGNGGGGSYQDPSTYTDKKPISTINIPADASIYKHNDNGTYTYIVQVVSCVLIPETNKYYVETVSSQAEEKLLREILNNKTKLYYTTQLSKRDITKGALARFAHSEGYLTTASGQESHAEGQNTIASNNGAHAEGGYTIASGQRSHSEGVWTTAAGIGAHAEGAFTYAEGTYSHAEGYSTTARGNQSHASGRYTIATQSNEFVCGKYNDPNNNGLFVVGSGTSATSRKNALTVKENSIIGTVNNVDDVYLGCPIGTMVMWMGQMGWEGYNLPVQGAYTKYWAKGIPEGWLLAKGGTFRLRWKESIDADNELAENKFVNRTDYVFAPRYTDGASHPYDNEHMYFDKFELIGYRLSVDKWYVVESEQNSEKFPDDATFDGAKCGYLKMPESERAVMTRFLNTIILYTKVYVTYAVFRATNVVQAYIPTIQTNQPYYQSGEHGDTEGDDSQARYLETRKGTPASASQILSLENVQIPWYSNSIIYGDTSDSNSSKEILISLPDMATRVPVGAAFGIGTFGGGQSGKFCPPLTGDGVVDNLAMGVYGGHEFSLKEYGEGCGYPQHQPAIDGYLVSATDARLSPTTIQPYMSVNFIIKYR